MKNSILNILIIFFISLLNSCNLNEKSNFSNIYWIHFEGAPLKLDWDLVLDPFHFKNLPTNGLANEVYEFYNTKAYFPEAWFDNKESGLLQNTIIARGLAVSSPHSKEARKEWFNGAVISSLFSDPTINKEILTQTSNLYGLYKNLISQHQGLHFYNGPVSTINKVVDHWINNSNTLNKPSLNISIHNQADESLVFDDLSTLNASKLNALKRFYLNFGTQVTRLVAHLKKKNIFHKSLILITSDRGRYFHLTKENELQTEPTWQGITLSMISGAIMGPAVIGHIYKDHPKYSTSYPGTTGVGVNEYSPHHVHLLIKEALYLSKNKDDKLSPRNPWVEMGPFNKFNILLPPGKIID